jgi:hypothetical protein
MKVSVPRGLRGKLALYSNSTRSVNPVLGPRGWGCMAEISADGGTSVTIYPKQQGAPPTGSATYPPTTELVTVTAIPACQGCMAAHICGIFPTAPLVDDYSSDLSCSTPPPTEEQTFLVGSSAAGYGTVLFVDPPGVKGTGVASGGKYSVLGVLSYGDTPRGFNESAKASCALPPGEISICHATVKRFVVSNWPFGAPPSPVPVPTTTTTVPPTTTTTMCPATGPLSLCIGGGHYIFGGLPLANSQSETYIESTVELATQTHTALLHACGGQPLDIPRSRSLPQRCRGDAGRRTADLLQRPVHLPHLQRQPRVLLRWVKFPEGDSMVTGACSGSPGSVAVVGRGALAGR